MGVPQHDTSAGRLMGVTGACAYIFIARGKRFGSSCRLNNFPESACTGAGRPAYGRSNRHLLLVWMQNGPVSNDGWGSADEWFAQLNTPKSEADYATLRTLGRTIIGRSFPLSFGRSNDMGHPARRKWDAHSRLCSTGRRGPLASAGRRWPPMTGGEDLKP